MLETEADYKAREGAEAAKKFIWKPERYSLTANIPHFAMQSLNRIIYCPYKDGYIFWLSYFHLLLKTRIYYHLII